MASIATLSARLDALLVGIRDALAEKLGATATAVNSTLLGGKTAAQIRADVLSQELGNVIGRPGEFAIFSEESVPAALRASPLLKTVRLAADDTAINNLKAATVSFSEVFDKWKRISHGNNLVFPHTPSELNSWSYDSGTDRISSTTNSASLIGIISNDRFDSYEFEVVLRSTAADDDGIGVCAAFKQVGEREHTLSVMVDGGGLNEDTVVNGNVAKLMVVVNYNQGVANGRVTLANLPLGIPNQLWTGADLAAGVRVMVKRTLANVLEVTCTRADGSAWPNPISWSGAIPALFQNKCPIGYLAISQAGASFENIEIPTSKDDIVDTRDTTVWSWVNDTWVNNGQYTTNPSAMQRGLFYKDTVGFGSYYLDLDGDMYKMGGPGTLG